MCVVTDYWNTIEIKVPNWQITDIVHDHLVNCQAERELSGLLRSTAEFRKEVTCPAYLRSHWFTRVRGGSSCVLWEMREKCRPSSSFWLDQVEDAEAKWHKHQDYKKAWEQRREKMGNVIISYYFLADSASPSCFMEVALFINSSATLGAIFVGLFCFTLFVRNWWPMSLESWGFDGCSAGRTSLRWLRPQGLNPPATHGRQHRVAKSNFKTSPASSSPSCSIWFQLHLIP